VLREAVKKARGNRKEIVGKIETAIKAGCAGGLTAEVIGREKHLYSIYQQDAREAPVLLRGHRRLRLPHHRRRVDTCYRVLGVVHNLYKPVPGRFKDYIAIPKANGYQSLHTVLFGPYGVPIEVQIRTEDMHRWPRPASPRTGCTRPATSRQQRAEARPRMAARAARDAEEGRQLAGVPRERQDRPVPDEVYVFTPAATSWSCRAAPPRWTSPTRCTPTSATPASRPRSTGAWRRCARRCSTARPSRSSPRPAPGPTRLAQLRGHRQGARQHPSAGSLTIKGTEGMVVSFAKCCGPIPGDPVIAIFSPGRGLVVHHHDCPNLGDFRRQGQSWLDVQWADNVSGEFSTAIRIDAGNQRGMLATIAALIAEEGSNIEDVRSEERDGLSTSLRFVVSVRGRKHLAGIIRRLKKIPFVLRLTRVIG
jgi:(p)ppGpp synthase/HD superfamily hydrolase